MLYRYFLFAHYVRAVFIVAFSDCRRFGAKEQKKKNLNENRVQFAVYTTGGEQNAYSCA